MAKVFLSAGHGGSDPGAVGNGLKEKDINLQILLSARAELERHGVQVVCSRTADANDPVREEVKEANASGADIAVSFHTNAGGGDGSETYYYPSNNGKGKRLAELCEAHVKALGQNSRGIKQGTKLHFVNSTKMTAVLCECAFIDNANDVTMINTVDKQQAFGKAYAHAILEFLNITVMPTVSAVAQPTEAPNATVKVDFAKAFSKSYARTYTVKSSDGILNMRAGAEASKALIKAVKTGEQVRCYGYFTKNAKGQVWLLCTYKNYSGFMLSSYLR